MKTFSKNMFKLTLALILLGFGCERIHQDELGISNYKYIGCKPTESIKSSSVEYLKVKIFKDEYLKIEHINALYNCYPDEITVEFEWENEKLIFNENEINPKANCICPYDLLWQIGPLEFKKYELIFSRDGRTFAEFEINFTSSMDSLIVDLLLNSRISHIE